MKRFAILFVSSSLLVASGCAKDEGRASEEAPASAKAPTAAPAPAGEAAPAPEKLDEASRHEQLTENAKKAIPTIADERAPNSRTLVAVKSPKEGGPTANEVAAARKVVEASASDKDTIPAAKATVAETDTYVVTVDGPQGKAGQDSKVSIVVKPKTGWKLNMDFPTKLKVEPPVGVTVAKKTLKKADAVEFSEKKGATWALSYKANDAGTKAFSGVLRFAVCTDATCDPKKAELAFNVQVK